MTSDKNNSWNERVKNVNSNKILLIISVRQRPGAAAALLGFALGKGSQSGHLGGYRKPFQEKTLPSLGCLDPSPVVYVGNDKSMAAFDGSSPGSTRSCSRPTQSLQLRGHLSPDPRSCSHPSGAPEFQSPKGTPRLHLPGQSNHPSETCKGALSFLPSLLCHILGPGDFPGVSPAVIPAPAALSCSVLPHGKAAATSPTPLWKGSGIWEAAGISLVPPNKAVSIVPLHCPPLSHNAQCSSLSHLMHI